MKVEQIYTGCLAQGAYFIQSKGEAAIIDPLRESAPYIRKAKAENVKIKYIFETHFHADFVSGHVDLAQHTGATIVFGPEAKTNYAIHQAYDGEQFTVGDIRIKVLHTPGHTLESTTYLLLDKNNKETAIFSGDTLFIGDVGRPDLAQKTDMSQDMLAGMLYDSLRQKIMVLPDDVIVYPAHGAGSACGKNMSKETTDTLGNQKRYNYALRANMTREEFIAEVTDGLMPPPAYFAQNVMLNKNGVQSLDQVLAQGLTPLDVEQADFLIQAQTALVIDTRSAADFAAKHISGAIFIGIDGGFAPWAGALIPDLKQPIIVVADQGREEEVVTRLSRVGFDNTLGYLSGGVQAWEQAGKPTDKVLSIEATAFEAAYQKEDTVLDVRKPKEFEAEHMQDATSFPLDFISENNHKLDKQEHYFIHCAGGYRSMIAASILKARGYHQITDIKGGFGSIKKTSLPLTAYVCPSSN